MGSCVGWPDNWPWFKQACYVSFTDRCDMLVGPCSCGASHFTDEFKYLDGTLYRYGIPCREQDVRHVALLPTGTERAACEDLAARQKRGMAKYGVQVADNPLTLREWLQHAYEECLDQAIYLKRAIEELDRGA